MSTLIPPPSRLYKYQPLYEDPDKNYSLKNLREQKLWFSKPESFNDPFDCNINFDIVDADKDENLQSLFVRLLDIAPDKNAFRSKYMTDGKINDSFKTNVIRMAKGATKSVIAMKQWGVSCFAESNDNILMWSHYTNSHKGFCLEFDTSFKPFKPIKIQTVLKVTYSEKYPSLSVDDIPNNLPSMPQNIFGTKSLCWCYEDEWRMFASPGGRSYSFDPLALTGVYLGYNIHETHKHEIAKMLHTFPSVKLYEMQRSESEFKVYPKEIFLL
ncbi:MAG: DUF2971 domain-containing protein [bacterium]|nr:DUF2971 domain-containing protein [bacterium]